VCVCVGWVGGWVGGCVCVCVWGGGVVDAAAQACVKECSNMYNTMDSFQLYPCSATQGIATLPTMLLHPAARPSFSADQLGHLPVHHTALLGTAPDHILQLRGDCFCL